MATDFNKIINDLLDFYDFNNQTVISVGSGGGQLVEYERNAKSVMAVDCSKDALLKLKDKLSKSDLEEQFTLIHSDFYQVKLKSDVVIFEFCLHEMKDPAEAIKHAQSMANNIIIVDHLPGSAWTYATLEDEIVANSWKALRTFNIRKIQEHSTTQNFNNYDELFQKLSALDDAYIPRIKQWEKEVDFSIPMPYGFALI